MIFAFDTLGYSKRLRDAGIPDSHADAHAEAAREFIMTELAIRSDVVALKSDLNSLREVVALKSDLAALKDTIALKSDLVEVKSDIRGLRANVDKLSLQLTVRLGGVVALGVGILAALQRMH